jgi:hypothetical protein
VEKSCQYHDNIDLFKSLDYVFQLFADMFGAATTDVNEPSMERANTDMRGGGGENRSPASGKGAPANYLQALLVGLMHQMGLFFTHSGSSHKDRAASVLFDQLLRHMNLLAKISHHHREIGLQRIGGPVSAGEGSPNYLVTLGDLTVKGTGGGISSGRSGAAAQARMDATLDRAFDCFATHGIDSLRLTLPGDSDDKVDQVRLTLNIIARFRSAVENSATIVFRYFGRSIRVPVVYDNVGRPDPNLTSMAGLNGISAANARELVKQADACRELTPADGQSSNQDAAVHNSSYDLIFGFSSLSASLIKPQIEINTLPWIVEESDGGNLPDSAKLFQKLGIFVAADDAKPNTANPQFAWRSFSVERFREPITYQFLANLLDADESKTYEAIASVTAEDFDRLDIQGVGQRLLTASTLIKAIEERNRDPLIVDRLIYHLHDQFLWVPEAVLTNIEVQPKGMKLHESGNTLVLGMVHPRILDMIALVKSAVVTRQKIRTSENVSFDFNYPNVRMLSERFGIDTSHALHLLRLLNGTISSAGCFSRPVFESQLPEMGRYGDTLFEIYYCLLRQMPRRADRLSMLDALSLMVSRLKNPVLAMRFVLDTIFHPDHQIEYADRNAFAVANCLLLQRSAVYPYSMIQTPDIWLSLDCRTPSDLLTYARWRLTADKVFVGINLEKVQMASLHRLVAQPGTRSKSASFLLALEREAIIFLSLIGTSTARTILRRALLRYSDPQSAIYQKSFKTIRASAIVDHLRTIIFAIGRTGNRKDISTLETIGSNLERLAALDMGTDYSRKIDHVLNFREAAMEAIRSR